jgi:hypothetical protein
MRAVFSLFLCTLLIYQMYVECPRLPPTYTTTHHYESNDDHRRCPFCDVTYYTTTIGVGRPDVFRHLSF